MDTEPRHVPDKENVPDTTETDQAALDRLLGELQFEETPQLSDARRDLITTLSGDPDNKTQTLLAWQEYFGTGDMLVEDMAGPLTSDNLERRTRLHLALMIHEALIYRETGNRLEYIKDLRGAFELARMTHHSEIAASLREVIAALNVDN